MNMHSSDTYPSSHVVYLRNNQRVSESSSFGLFLVNRVEFRLECIQLDALDWARLDALDYRLNS